jgi:acyl transferase domain-containing protein
MRDHDISREREPIAIVGMGCRLPGAENVTAFWRLLLEERAALREIPQDRHDLATLFNPAPATPGHGMTRWAGVLDGIDRFDAQFFGMAPREAELMDPQQRLLLEVSWEALEDAGIQAGRSVDSDAAAQVGPLPMGLSGFGRTDDRCTPSFHLEGWREETRGPFRIRLFSEGHFYLEARRAKVLSEVAGTLAPMLVDARTLKA